MYRQSDTPPGADAEDDARNPVSTSGSTKAGLPDKRFFYCHLHLVPRRPGDVENPRGGVREEIPAKQSYREATRAGRKTMNPTEITRKHAVSDIEELRKGEILQRRQATRFDLAYEGHSYPPKVVISVAARFATGVELLGGGVLRW